MGNEHKYLKLKTDKGLQFNVVKSRSSTAEAIEHYGGSDNFNP